LERIRIGADSVLFPSFSADARLLYFATPAMQGAAQPLDPAGVWRATIDQRWRAGKPELLIPFHGAEAHDVAMSADGSHIAISQMLREGALWTVPLDRAGLAVGEPKPLIHDASMGMVEPVFSPDGSKLAFASIRQGGEWTIFVAGSDGSSPKPVTAGGQSARIISWAANDTLAYIGEREGQRRFWIAPLHGTPKTVDLKLDLGPYAIIKASPRGNQVVAHSGNRNIGIKLVLIDLATGESRDLTPPGRTFVFPNWSPDGRWISAVERVGPKTDHRVVIDASTGTIQTLVDAQDEPAFFQSNWAPDNDRIVYASPHDGVSNIYWVSRSTGKLQQVTRFESQSAITYQPAWSPKGDQIVFQHGDMVANIYVGELRF
jgi:Tol biopolymer transport system component